MAPVPFGPIPRRTCPHYVLVAAFIQVGFEHFLRILPDEERVRAEEILDEQRRTGQDASAW